MAEKLEADSGGLSLLGGFVFSAEGDSVLGISVGSQRLLAFLAERDRPVTRKKVAGTLWPDSTDERAGASLRAAVSRLEGPVRHAVESTGADLELVPGVHVDLRRARSLAHRLIDTEAPLSQGDISGAAVSALSEDLLPGWYDEWILLPAEHWHLLRTQALEAIAGHLTDAGRYPEAVAAALAAVRAEPLRETSRAALIRVQMAEGNQVRALGEYEHYRILLQAELGLEPTSRLSRLLSRPAAE